MRPVFDVADSMGVQNRLKLLQMSPARRRRLLSNLGRKVRVNSRKRLRTQTDLNGQPFHERASNSRKRMLAGMSKRMHVKASETDVEIGFTAGTGIIARKQQEGIGEVMTAEKAARINGKRDYAAPCTRSQARALRDAGYKVRRSSGKGWRRASMKEILATVTQGQAGLVRKILQDQGGNGTKKKWVIPLPARSFLGVTPAEQQQLVDDIFNALIQEKR